MIFPLLCLATASWAWSPTGDYAPGTVSCPAENFVRAASGISSSESEWVASRNKVTDVNVKDFLQNSGLDNFDVDAFLANTSRSLTIGVAFSGGGYRAMLSGAGQISALDSRTVGANTDGLGGLLQSATYLAGLSGGNWLVGSLAMNNWTSVQAILDGDEIWDLEELILSYGGWDLVADVEYWESLLDDVDEKHNAGFVTTLTDTWGRALSHDFFTKLIDYGNSLLWLQIQECDAFTSHEMPFPIVVSDGKTPGTSVVSGNSTIFEFNPFELGSWDPSLYAFTNVKYLGTEVSDGVPVDGKCVGGYDNAGFVMGTSSALFNSLILEVLDTDLPDVIKDLVEDALNGLTDDLNDLVAVYKPNPFANTTFASGSLIPQDETLYLADGGEDDQNIPLYPLLQPERKLDVIFAYDNSADTDSDWPDGASLVALYERQFLKQGNGTIFPYVPDTNTFLALNLTSKPTFFGCDAKNLTSLLPSGAPLSAVYDSPLLVYTANTDITYELNKSTFKLSYTESEKRSMIENGFEVALRGNFTLDAEWRACVACAIIRREQERQGTEQSEQCKKCFEEYCWNGETVAASDNEKRELTEPVEMEFPVAAKREVEVPEREIKG